MSPETLAFLDGVRRADDPTPDDERRVLGAVHGAVAAGLVVGGAAGASKATKISALFGASGLKLFGVFVGIGAFWWIGGWVFPRHEAAPLFAIASAGHRPSEPAPPSSISQPLPSALGEPEKPPARPRTSDEARSRAPGPASLREEIALLAEVQAALAGGDGATALARLDGHVTADRQLLTERRAARILALCSLGREDEARHAAAEFLRTEPASVQRGVVERSCAGTKRGDER